MTEPRLTSGFRVAAHIRTLAAYDIPAFVVRKGDETAGQVLVKINRLVHRGEPGCRVFVQSYDAGGGRVWRAGTGPGEVTEAEADAYIDRTVRYDPDAWVIEVEDAQGRHMLEPVEGDGDA
ncbi:DUF1491 family protein [Futiania mangrovi]|uniref:DUF1491 family protein n=1 Tax=Futiania mangrovi TaxID=2959716 RepID=A0A9J6PD49_9PROT|nr:DUF1491 family protein [Futiania mangrovii]MCP1337301.1 DUF1491 family protein [Futiania mangrovii]